MSNGFGPIGSVPVRDVRPAGEETEITVGNWWTSSDSGVEIHVPSSGTALSNSEARSLAHLLLMAADGAGTEVYIRPPGTADLLPLLSAASLIDPF
jgi:hypothetical protein